MVTKHDLPSFDSYFVPTVQTLKARGGSATIEEMEDDVAKAMELSDELLAVPHGDGPRSQFQYELAWVRTYLKKAGAAENSERGVWRLTQRGAAMSDDEIRGIRRWVVAQRRRAKLSDGDDVLQKDDEDDEETSLSWKERLLEALLELSPDKFERLCQRLLRESGFTKVEVTGRSGDGGIDGVGVLRVNLLSFHVLFQSKRWRGTVGASTVRDFRGAMVGRADKGLILTTGTFTADARREATRDGAPAIDLVDGDALCDLLKSLKIGVTVTLVENVEVDDAALAEV
jgi:restriction system protein